MKHILLTALICAFTASTDAATPAAKPNVVYIMSDDVGWGDLSVHGGGVRLPTVIHWRKGGLVGGKKWNGLCGALDMFPTLMAMTESKMPPTRPLDGKNI